MPGHDPGLKSKPKPKRLNAQQKRALTMRVKDWFRWLWGSVVIPLLRANFYITEVDGCANKVRVRVSCHFLVSCSLNNPFVPFVFLAVRLCSL